MKYEKSRQTHEVFFFLSDCVIEDTSIYVKRFRLSILESKRRKVEFEKVDFGFKVFRIFSFFNFLKLIIRINVR